MSTNSPYTAAITGGGFLWEETNVLLPLLQAENREELLKDERVNNRLLHSNAETSRYRFIMDIAKLRRGSAKAGNRKPVYGN